MVHSVTSAAIAPIAASTGASISVAMGLDNNYLYPTIVSIISVMENKNEKTLYDFYVMHTPEFEERNKTKLLSLREKYENSDISLIDMGESFKNASR